MFISQYKPTAAPCNTDFVIALQGSRLWGSGPLRRHELPITWTIAHQVFLGTWNEEPLWGISIAEEETSQALLSWNEIRSFVPVWDAAHFHCASFAKHILWWHGQYRFCPRCGTALENSTKERAKTCSQCDNTIYPVIAPAIIVAVQRAGKLLLAHNRNFAGTRHSVIAGFVEAGETLEQTVAREVREEVGLQIRNIHYVTSQAWAFPNSLMLGFTAEWASGDICVDGEEIDHADWYGAEDLPDLPPPGSISRQ